MRFALVFLLACLPSLLFAEEQAPPVLAAGAYALYDVSSDQFLLQQNADTHVAPAQLTKLMTAYVVFEAIRQGKLTLTQHLTASAYATRTQGNEPRMYLNAGQDVTVEELLRGLIVLSANDAARVLAEKIANHEIALTDSMNSEAQRLGLNNTHFANATGLPDAQNYSTAHDLALLAAALIRDFPEYYHFYAQREYQYNGVSQFNRNRLLWLDPYIDGLSSGLDETDKYHMVASALRGDHRLLAVVLGADTEKLRNSESQRLLNYGFQDFETFRLYAANQALSAKRIWKGTSSRLDIGFRTARFVTLPKGQRDALKATLETHQPMFAPVHQGQIVGMLHLTLHDQPFLDLPVSALDEVSVANVFSRGVDTIRLLFE